jgi:hypothetical protein
MAAKTAVKKSSPTKDQLQAMLTKMLDGIDDYGYYQDLCSAGQSIVDEARTLLNREQRYEFTLTGRADIPAGCEDAAYDKIKCLKLVLTDGREIEVDNLDYESSGEVS